MKKALQILLLNPVCIEKCESWRRDIFVVFGNLYLLFSLIEGYRNPLRVIRADPLRVGDGE